ncbi:glycosyltransferase family 2 protein [Streptomyces sp. NBC_00178]|uniref:glycosyltransferase n=1 Tax=Streptomyces sp. NBC_00178 TaxID=2975672 RepID=UPI002E2865D4|nr:glycosyltransferase family 2 protein [Streptomyces sp. NBC_00178]
MTGLAAIAVVIPAHDEETFLPAALASVRTAARHPAVRASRLLVVVAADACTDRTYEVARQGGAVVATLDARSPGEARAAGSRLALSALGLDPATVWIASTDADSEVPTGWLAHQRACAERGWDAVVGTIRPQGWPPALADVIGDHVRAYATAGGEGQPSGLHPHVHGANLGVRADAYLRVGGFPALTAGEDHALVAALQAHGYQVLRTRRFPVLTSARLAARARGGYADHLAQLVRDARPSHPTVLSEDRAAPH